MSDKKEAQAEAQETKEKEEAEKTKKIEKKVKKTKESKATTESAKTKGVKKAKKTKKTTKKTTKKKVTKPASEEKPKSTKKATKPKKTTKPEKKTTKPAKKATKKTETKPKKEAAEKKTTKKSPTRQVHKYEKWILEAIVSLSTEDKPYVSYEKIKNYLFTYMDGTIAGTIPYQTRKTLDKLHEKGLIKKKKESYALRVAGKKVAPTTIEKRKKVPEREIKPKRQQMVAYEPVETKEFITFTGRVSKQRVI